MKINIMTLFPQMCEAVFSESIVGRAVKEGKIEVEALNIRDFTTDKHNRVDFAPYGGGGGMIMQCQPIYDCYRHICERAGGKKVHLIYMSPQGRVLTQERARELAELPEIALLCGHYEGVDERVIEEIADEEISIGDYVLTGGELPALVLTDVIARMQDGVLTRDEAFMKESHYDGLLEYPQYTRPFEWNGRRVPEVLLSGNHAQIDKWRRAQAYSRTMERRPDMMENYNGGEIAPKSKEK